MSSSFLPDPAGTVATALRERSRVLASSLPLHASQANANVAHDPPVKIARVPSVANQWVIQFTTFDVIQGNLLEKELLRMGKDHGILMAGATAPNTLADTRVLLRLTLKTGTNVKTVLQTCLQRIQAELDAMEASFVSELQRQGLT